MTLSNSRKKRRAISRRTAYGRPMTHDVNDGVEVIDTNSWFYGVIGRVTHREPKTRPNQDQYTLDIGHMRGLRFRGSQLRPVQGEAP